jgi:hypothetical protein
MNRRYSIRHQFVALLPEVLEDGVLYISVQYKGMVHLCFCGCGKRVVTPLSPNGWSMTFDGRRVTLSPSIGSWNLACRSHYWIRHNTVEWIPERTSQAYGSAVSGDSFATGNVPASRKVTPNSRSTPNTKQGLLQRALAWLGLR